MVNTGTGQAGLKQSHGLWTNKVLIGGSEFGQAAGSVIEFAVSGTQPTAYIPGVIQAENISQTGSLVTQGNIINSLGSPWKNGLVLPLTARENVSGGMFVYVSGPMLGMSTAVAATGPIGVCVQGAASGGTIQVLTHGIYPMNAEGTIVAGAGVKPGAGLALNTVLDAGSPSYGVVGTAMQPGASGTAAPIFVFIGKGNSN